MESLRYAGGRLDRADRLRRDAEGLAARLTRPDTRLVPVWRDRNLIAGLDDEPPSVAGVAAVAPSGTGAARIVAASAETVFLGLDGRTAVFAADLSDLEEEAARDLAGTGGFVDLRRAGPLMKSQEAALVAYARGVLHWHRSHRFCSRCGTASESRDGGHIRVCGNPDCGRRTFPRTDPAVIMLVEHRPNDGSPPRCLLGRHRRLPPGVFSTLAGFVEPGESLEETVAREVREEAGVRVAEVAYQGSQPWPFPASIMLGFRARARTTEITLDDDELDDARWFTAEEVRGFGEWAEEDAPRRLPRKDSIARSLIRDWVEEVEGG
jgi:NAD+ diphosphatase